MLKGSMRDALPAPSSLFFIFIRKGQKGQKGQWVYDSHYRPFAFRQKMDKRYMRRPTQFALRPKRQITCLKAGRRIFSRAWQTADLLFIQICAILNKNEYKEPSFGKGFWYCAAGCTMKGSSFFTRRHKLNIRRNYDGHH